MCRTLCALTRAGSKQQAADHLLNVCNIVDSTYLALSHPPAFPDAAPHLCCALRQVQVTTLDGDRSRLLLGDATTLRALQSEVRQATGLPRSQQRLAVVVHEPPGHALRALRLLAAGLLTLCAWLAAVLRWLLGLPPPGRVSVTVQTEGGRELELAVRSVLGGG